MQDVTGTPAAPYLLRHPVAPTANAATVVFLPGGSGARRSAQRVWDNVLTAGAGGDAFRIVVPYWPQVEMLGDVDRVLAIVDEVLACWGGDRNQIHLAGTSNGGHAAFDLMIDHPSRFATLLGAPGELRPGTTAADLAPLKGKAVFNGIGERDDEFWHKGVRDAHAAFVEAGVESAYVEFPGQGHSAGADFPSHVLFEFWAAHSK